MLNVGKFPKSSRELALVCVAAESYSTVYLHIQLFVQLFVQLGHDAVAHYKLQAENVHNPAESIFAITSPLVLLTRTRLFDFRPLF